MFSKVVRSSVSRFSAVRASCRSASSQAPRVQNFINGVFEDSKTQEWIPVINPATQEIVSYVPQSTKEELERAERGSIEAFKTWREVPVQQRQVIRFLICFVLISSD